MKKLVLAIWLAAGALTVSARYSDVDGTKLNEAYARLVAAEPTDTAVQTAFLAEMPSDWIEFVCYYDCPSDEQLSPLFDDCRNHLDALKKIGGEKYLTRIVELSVGATYRPVDNPSVLLQSHLRDAVADEQTRDALLRLVDTMMTSDQMLFWQFYWSNFIAKGPDMTGLYEHMMQKWPRQAEIMKTAHDSFLGHTPYFRHTSPIGQRQYEGKC